MIAYAQAAALAQATLPDDMLGGVHLVGSDSIGNAARTWQRSCERFPYARPGIAIASERCVSCSA
jgi:hypothetical protein